MLAIKLERPLEHAADPRVVGHAVSLSEDERREAVVVHVAMAIGHIQQAGRLGMREHIVEGLLDILAILAAARQMAVGQKRERSHAHQPEIVRLPIAFGPLILGEPRKPALQRGFALRRDLPIAFAAGGPYAEAYHPEKCDRCKLSRHKGTSRSQRAAATYYLKVTCDPKKLRKIDRSSCSGW